MSFRCLQSLMQNIIDVHLLYKDNIDNGQMYSGNGTPPLCSSAHPPPPSNCTVCLYGVPSNQSVYVVCANLLKNEELVMEGGGQTIELIVSECPGLLATNENADLSGHDTAWKLWLPIVIVLLMILVVVVYKCKQKIRERITAYRHRHRPRDDTKDSRTSEELELQ